jgi:hypothetical protein
MPAPRNQQSGFTLIEAAVAALILLVAIVFVAQMFVTAMEQNRTARRHTHATAIAQSKLEELNATPLERLQYGGDLGTADGGDRHGLPGFSDFVLVDGLDSENIGVVERERANYARYWKIEPDPAGWAGMYRITVRVISLRHGEGKAREEATLATVRTQF